MSIRNAMRLSAVTALLVGSLMAVHSQSGQAPFTIRRPQDGSTVRENVRVEIPRASIGRGGFVAIYLDNKFELALAPDPDDDASKPFTFAWDTKANKVSDGEHSVRAVLYEPASGSGVAVNQKGSSEVRLTVANKITDGPSSLLLRYKNREGDELDYERLGKSLIVGGVSEMGKSTGDQILASVRSKLRFDVQDVRFDSDRGVDVSLVRNKLTELAILQSGQEVTLDPGQLSNSMYQELSPQGNVFYETGTAAGLAEFMQVGLPVNNTLELPELPTGREEIGATWTTERQRLDIPGLPPALQPRVTLRNKLEDLEWESGYPTARIHQTYSGTPPNSKAIQFGPINVTSPTVIFERDIYVAYNSGKLIKTTRTLTVKGRTTAILDPSEAASGAAGGFPGSGGYPGSSGSPGSGGLAGYPMTPGMPGGYPGSGGAAGGRSGGYPGSSGSSASGGYPGSGGGSGSGGYPGSGGGGRTRTQAAAPRKALTIREMMASRGGSGMVSGLSTGMATEGMKDKAVVLQAVTTTQLLGAHADETTATVRPAAVKSVKRIAPKKRHK